MAHGSELGSREDGSVVAIEREIHQETGPRTAQEGWRKSRVRRSGHYHTKWTGHARCSSV
eukprot:2720543-Amphidinium_carterae.1